MQNQEIDLILSEWSDELIESLGKNKSLCVALFGVDRKLLFATPVMDTLFKDEPYKSLINPTFDQLLEIKSESSLIFEGLLTIGNNNSINSSIAAHVFLKDGKMLVVGGADTVQLLDQNTEMHNLNRQINNLQRQLIREKFTLENTLNKLNETNSELQQINATKDKFFSIIAHDLRSPFQSLLNLPELILEDYDTLSSDEIKKAFDDIAHDARKVFTLLNNLLEWARVQTDGLSVSLEKFYLKEFVSEIVNLLKGNADNKKVKLDSDIEDGILVNADKNMLHTILRNLVSNAIKFTNADDSIIICAKKSNGFIEISVNDTGIGIDDFTLKKLFKLEEKVTSKGTAKEIGTGLGLLLCKELVEKMNGKIWVESEVGIGSSFRFTLPI